MTQSPFAACQSFLDLAQRLRLRQLAKTHRHKLLPTTKPLRSILRSGAPHRRFKLRPIHEI